MSVSKQCAWRSGWAGRALSAAFATCVIACGSPATEGGGAPETSLFAPSQPVDPPSSGPEPEPTPGPSPAPEPSEGPPPAEIEAKFDALAAELADRMSAAGVPGGALAVVYGDQVMARGVGVRALSTGAPVTEHTVFSIASVTKMVTATAFMALVDQGKANLDAPATQLLQELKLKGAWPASSITAAQLMSHSSGYPNYADDTYSPFGDSSPNAISKYLTSYQHLSLDFAPGSKFSYSNFGFALVGLMVERAGGAPYAQVVRDRVLAPAQMPDATFSYMEAEARDHALPHFKENGKIDFYLPYSTPFYEPFGGLYASAVDLARFAQVFLQHGGSVMSSEAADKMTSGYFQGFMGLGAFHLDSPIGAIAYHGGSQLGFLTDLYVAIDAKFAVAVTINADWDENLTVEIQRSAFQRFVGLDLPI